jgi:hypothetical protein
LGSRWEAVHVLDSARADTLGKVWRYHERYPLKFAPVCSLTHCCAHSLYYAQVNARTLESANSALYYDVHTKTLKQYSDRAQFVNDMKQCEVRG